MISGVGGAAFHRTFEVITCNSLIKYQICSVGTVKSTVKKKCHLVRVAGWDLGEVPEIQQKTKRIQLLD